MGSVDIYNDLFDKYPQLLGGAIWEWQDQGIYNNRDPNHPIIAFGSGFGEYTNDHYFIHKGVVLSGRSRWSVACSTVFTATDVFLPVMLLLFSSSPIPDW